MRNTAFINKRYSQHRKQGVPKKKNPFNLLLKQVKTWLRAKQKTELHDNSIPIRINRMKRPVPELRGRKSKCTRMKIIDNDIRDLDRINLLYCQANIECDTKWHQGFFCPVNQFNFVHSAWVFFLVESSIMKFVLIW